MNYIGYYDGSANPNPGKLGLGITIFADSKELVCAAKPAGYGTNNEAEYLALILLLELALQEGIKHITVYGDSQLITNQVNGKWGVGKDKLVKYHANVLFLAAQFSHIEFKWIKRANNKRADLLSKRGGELDDFRIYRTVPFKVQNVLEETSITPKVLPKKTVSPTINTKVVSISRTCFLITDKDGISKLELLPTVRCTCRVFFKEGACVHTDSVLRLIGAKVS